MHRPDPSSRTGAIPLALDTTANETSPRVEGGTHGRAVPCRSSRAEVRNPLLNLQAAKQIRALPPPARQELAALLHELSVDARERAQRSWRQNKAPMALYWKTVSVYAGHLHRAVRPTRAETARVVLERSRALASAPSRAWEDE
jgi:hypothetical protein